MHRNKIYFGDNLEVMREVESKCVDLICTDPPFNSGRNYNIFLPAKAQEKAFTDIWKWDDYSKEMRSDVEYRSRTNKTYEAINNALIGYDYIFQHKQNGDKGGMRSYLAFMAPRLVEMYRLLKDTGSLYLHCDPSASHYLKGLLDVIFEKKHFINEIVWSYLKWNNPSGCFPRGHDIILAYKKTNQAVFNPLHFNELSESKKSVLKRGYITQHLKNHEKQLIIYDESTKGSISKINSGEYTKENIKYLDKEKAYQTNRYTDVWTDIFMLSPKAKERLGYPTQKPRMLYERLIKASSNEGDIVLDPFAGCATTIDAAQALNRKWLGIDLTLLALEPMQDRLFDRYGFRSNIDYDIEGYPTNIEEVHTLVNNHKKYHDFSNWAVTRLGLKPTSNVKDGGFDGIEHFTIWIPEGMKQNKGRIMAEVKTGKPTLPQVRAFCHAMNKNKAIAGVFITLHKVSVGMKEEAESMGTFEHNKISYPRLQFWQITQEYFDNPDSINKIIRLPKAIKASKKSERYVKEDQMEMDL